MIKVLLYLWQLPQNLLGLFLVHFTDARKSFYVLNKNTVKYYKAKKHAKTWGGVSLGNYIVVSYGNTSVSTILHEAGHQKQSRYLGIFYLLIIGLPSLIGNLWDRVFHKHWNNQKRIDWYYSQPWEAWADKLGGVIRW